MAASFKVRRTSLAHARRDFLIQLDKGFAAMDVDGSGLPDIAATIGESAIS